MDKITFYRHKWQKSGENYISRLFIQCCCSPDVMITFRMARWAGPIRCMRLNWKYTCTGRLDVLAVPNILCSGTGYFVWRYRIFCVAVPDILCGGTGYFVAVPAILWRYELFCVAVPDILCGGTEYLVWWYRIFCMAIPDIVWRYQISCVVVPDILCGVSGYFQHFHRNVFPSIQNVQHRAESTRRLWHSEVNPWFLSAEFASWPPSGT
jgi:hypothetical protein